MNEWICPLCGEIYERAACSSCDGVPMETAQERVERENAKFLGIDVAPTVETPKKAIDIFLGV